MSGNSSSSKSTKVNPSCGPSIQRNDKHKSTKNNVYRGEEWFEVPNHNFDNVTCVRCGGPHIGTKCTLSGREAKCVNCHGPHPANYTGCPVYQRLKRGICECVTDDGAIYYVSMNSSDERDFIEDTKKVKGKKNK